MPIFGASARNGKIVTDVAIYLDSNVFIDALERDADESGPARTILRAAEARQLRAFTSELTLAEVLVRPERERLFMLKRAYLKVFGPRSVVTMCPVSRDILIESTRYRAIAYPRMPGPDETRRNFLPDSIHVVTAIDVGAAFYVGRDNRVRLPAGMRGIRADEDGVRALLQR